MAEGTLIRSSSDQNLSRRAYFINTPCFCRVLLDRCSDTDDPWSLLDYKIQHGVTTPATEIKDW